MFTLVSVHLPYNCYQDCRERIFSRLKKRFLRFRFRSLIILVCALHGFGFFAINQTALSSIWMEISKHRLGWLGKKVSNRARYRNDVSLMGVSTTEQDEKLFPLASSHNSFAMEIENEIFMIFIFDDFTFYVSSKVLTRFVNLLHSFSNHSQSSFIFILLLRLLKLCLLWQKKTLTCATRAFQ